MPGLVGAMREGPRFAKRGGGDGTSNPMGPKPTEGKRPGSQGGEVDWSMGLGEMMDNTQGYLEDFWKEVLTNHHFRASLIYLVYLLVFSMVILSAKPNNREYHLHQQVLNYYEEQGMMDVTDEAGLWVFLHATLSDLLYPETDYNDKHLSDIYKLFLLGQGRVVGAMRLSQKRSVMDKCRQLPKWLRDIGVYATNCTTAFSEKTMETLPFAQTIEEGVFDADGTLGNFTMPFTYRNADELNTTDLLWQRGQFGSFYPQSGYTIDFVPNLASHWFAERVQSCMPLLQASTNVCMEEQGVVPDVEVKPPAPPANVPQPPPLVLGNEADAGMALTDERSRTPPPNGFVSALTHKMTLDSTDKTEDEYEFKLHNPGCLILNWDWDPITKRDYVNVPWIKAISIVDGGTIEGIGCDGGAGVDYGGCSAAADCVGTTIRVTVQQDDWMRNQTSTGSIVQTMAHAEMPKFTFKMQARDYMDTIPGVSVTLEMFYTAPVPPGRKLLQAPEVDPETGQSIPTDPKEVCREREEIVEQFKQPDGSTQTDVIVPSLLDRKKCGLITKVIPSQSDADQKRLKGFLAMCELQQYGYEDLLELSSACGKCKCKPSSDEFCRENCNPRSVYIDQIEKLKEFRWFDRQTRAIILDIPLLHQNFNMFQVIRLMFEFYEAGGHSGVSVVTPKIISRSFRLYRYVTFQDLVIAGAEFVLIVMTFGYTGQAVMGIKELGWKYFNESWNWMDVATLIMVYTVIALRCVAWLTVQAFDFDSLGVKYVDFFFVGFIAKQELNVGAMAFFFFYFKFFKYLNLVPRMGIVFATLRSAAFDLLLFSIVFMVVMFGFAGAFYVVFSAETKDCKSLGDTFGALFRILLGDFNYKDYEEANPTLAPFMFYSFILLVTLILLNMFLAILADAYMEVKTNQTEQDLEFYRNLRVQVVSAVQKTFRKKDAVASLTKELQEGLDLDGIIDIRELQEMLEGNPRALAILKAEGAKDLMKKYDISGDGVLDKEELKEVLVELAQKEAELQAEIDEEAAKSRGDKGGGGGGKAANKAPKTSVKAAAPTQQQLVAHGGDPEYLALGGGVDNKELAQHIEKVDMQLKEMSRNVAKKLSLMIDLMMSLSDQVTSVRQGESLNDRDHAPPGAIMPAMR